jgi:hypothetical protein
MNGYHAVRTVQLGVLLEVVQVGIVGLPCQQVAACAACSHYLLVLAVTGIPDVRGNQYQLLTWCVQYLFECLAWLKHSR